MSGGALEYATQLWPFIVAAVAVAVAYGRVSARVTRIAEDVTALARSHDLLASRADNHEIDLARLGERFAAVNAQLDRVEAKLDRLIERM